MQKAIWKDSYLIANKTIDDQHKNLFDIVNQLTVDLPKPKRESLLMEIYKHTREHFRDEEAIMINAHYLYLNEHREDHNRMLVRLTSHIEAIREDPDQIELLHQFLLDWINFHVIKDDLALTHYLDEQ
jgi:hemerythrin